MNDQQNNPRGRGDRELLEALRRLGGAIDHQRYPGVAWVAPKRRRLVWILWPAAAAAAAVLLAVLLSLPDRGPMTPPEIVERADPKEIEEPMAWAMPIDIAPVAPVDVDPAVGAYLAFELPDISLPETNGSGEYDWSTPHLSLPEQEERSNNHDS